MAVDKTLDKHILIVDDDAGQRSLLKSFLVGQGFTIVCAASGNEALSLLDSARPDMLISDVRMPGLSGLELLARVHEQMPSLPVLLVTAYADVRDAVGAIRIGQFGRTAEHGLLRIIERAIPAEGRNIMQAHRLLIVRKVALHGQRRRGKNPAARAASHQLSEGLGHRKRRGIEMQAMAHGFHPVNVIPRRCRIVLVGRRRLRTFTPRYGLCRRTTLPARQILAEGRAALPGAFQVR